MFRIDSVSSSVSALVTKQYACRDRALQGRQVGSWDWPIAEKHEAAAGRLFGFTSQGLYIMLSNWKQAWDHWHGQDGTQSGVQRRRINMKRSFLFLHQGRLTGFSALALTLLVTVLSALVSLAARPAIYATPYMLFSGAVLASAWLGSFRQSLVPIGLGALFVNYFLRPPGGHFSLSPEDLQRAAVWALVAGTFAFSVSRLRASESHALKVLAGIGDGFFVLDRDWNLVYINKAGAQATGKFSHEMIGRNYWEVVPEAKGTVVEQQLRRCAAEGLPLRFETRTQRLQRWLQFPVYPFAEGISVFFQDISEAKEREEKLRSSLERLATAPKTGH